MKSYKALVLGLSLVVLLSGCLLYRTKLPVEGFGTLKQTGIAFGNTAVKASMQDFDGVIEKYDKEGNLLTKGTVKSNQSAEGIETSITPEAWDALVQSLAQIASMVALL